MLYPTLRNLLFLLEPETAHTASLNLLKTAHRLGLLSKRTHQAPKTVMGLTFTNPVGLAAGMDKNGDYIDALAALGFGFIEIGTVTPKPQPGNPKPRLFRLPKVEALINRMGFNNHGVEYLVAQVKKAHYTGVLGINIGKNFDTPIADATQDYLHCMRQVYPYASYITINISSPNTPGLRDLQYKTHLDHLLETLKQEQASLERTHKKYTPIALKISPDLDNASLEAIAQSLLAHKIDAVIATNTTVSRSGVENLANANETGGLSGHPLATLSIKAVEQLAATLKGRVPIIGVGGVLSTNDAERLLNAGAELIQLYTGFIYKGPGFIRRLSKTLP